MTSQNSLKAWNLWILISLGGNILGREVIDRIVLQELIDSLFLRSGILVSVTSGNQFYIEIPDHYPLLLQCGNWEKANSYFKSENRWLKIEGFYERVKEWWGSFNFLGSPNFVLVAKLKALKTKLKEWSKTSQRNLGIQKQSVLD